MANAVGFVFHPRIDTAQSVVADSCQHLERAGFRVFKHHAQRKDREALLPELDHTDLLVSVGGDGTFLWTARQAAQAHIPVLGVNSGRLGFLAPVPMAGMCQALDRWMAGDFLIEERSLLRATVNGGPTGHLAVNDVVVHKGIEFNLIRLEVLVDDQPAGSFDADGVVIATATGSTGYSVSLGGPILRPDVRDIVLTPLNPHSLFNRALVLPESTRLTVRLPQESALLTCDGQVNESLSPPAAVEVAVAPDRARVVRIHPEPDFFTMLRQKLRWGLPLIDGDA